jgi:tyrosine-protein kinase
LGPAEHSFAHAATLRDYLHVVRRRKWIILQALVLVPLAAVVFSLQEQKLYRASAQVLLSTQNLAATLTGTQQTGINQDPNRIAQTQADVARVRLLAQRVLAAAPGTGLKPQGFLDSSSVSTATNADLLDFAVTNHDPSRARRLVDAYAAAYVAYRRQLDTAAIQNALAGVNRRIDAMTKAHARGALYASLVDRQQTLQTMEALQTSNASVVQQGDQVVQTQPKTVRNGILGVVLGVVLGLMLAFLWESLDTRVRSAEEISERLGGLPLLARVPAPPKKLGAKNRLVMLESPAGPHAEAFRMLRTNLDFVTLDGDAQTIMVTSAVDQEGKSTTVANLAVALARAGKRVVLVDLDLRRPFLARFFDLAGPGVTQVALGHVKLESALASIAFTDAQPGGRHAVYGYRAGNGNGAGQVAGTLDVLPSGPVPPDPGEFVGSRKLAEILAALRERADVVLVDAPPVLQVGDAMTLSSAVDGIVVLTRMKVVRRHMLHELARQLATVPTRVLGFVVADAGGEEGYGYGYGYAYSPRKSEPVGWGVER